MKQILTYYAGCNRQINEQMNEVIGKNLPDPYGLALGGYYFKTLGQLLDHIFAADMIWMKAFSDLEAYGLDLAGAVRPVPGYGDPVFDSFDAYLAGRRTLDAFICQYMDLVQDSLFDKVVTRRTRDGQLIERPAAQALVHFFNHQTHHRGQISNILDNQGIENNYSNMISLKG